MLLSEGEQQAELSKLFPSFFGDGVAESTPLTVCQETGASSAFPDMLSLTLAPFFIPPVPSDGQCACMSALVLLISLAGLPATHSPRPISPAATFSLSLHCFPSPIVEFATKKPRPSERLSPESCCSETLGIDKANERPHPNKATTSPRAIPGVHRQLERRAD